MERNDLEATHSIPNDSVVVIPMGVPLPAQLDGTTMITGSLYQRLLPICDESPITELTITPLSGTELASLTACWELLSSGRAVYVLVGLPGTLSDITFAHAARALGLRVVDWIDVQGELEARVLETQRASARPPETEPVVGHDDGARDSSRGDIRTFKGRRTTVTQQDVTRRSPSPDMRAPATEEFEDEDFDA